MDTAPITADSPATKEEWADIAARLDVKAITFAHHEQTHMAASLASLSQEPLRGKTAIFTHLQQHRLASEATATLLQIASTARLVRELGAFRAYEAIRAVRKSQKEADHV